MFRSSFIEFLQSHGVNYTSRGELFLFPEHHLEIVLVPLLPEGQCAEDEGVAQKGGVDRLYLYEDRWFSGGEVLRARILSRMGRFRSLFARKCNVISGPKTAQQVAEFLEKYHMYGSAQCKHRYALIYEGEVVAVATFSKPRPIPREDGRTYLSFEWVRYASVPGVRVVGGMGRLLKAFEKDARAIGLEVGMPVEVMSYSDNEWSVGDAYTKLGFRQIGERAPVRYMVDPQTFERYSLRKFSLLPPSDRHYCGIHNRGSKKFLLTW